MCSHLITKNADTACTADLIRTKPHCSQARWHRQDKSLANGHQTLAKKRDPETISCQTKDLYPWTKGGTECAKNRGISETLKCNYYRKLFMEYSCTGMYVHNISVVNSSKFREIIISHSLLHNEICLRIVDYCLWWFDVGG